MPTVLVVDDDHAIRELTCAFVRAAGYEAIAAGGAKEAVEVARSFAPIDILIADLVMPDGDGFELAEAVRRYQPDAKILYVSGWADMRWTGAFLAKPYGMGDLSDALRDLTASGDAEDPVTARHVAA